MEQTPESRLAIIYTVVTPGITTRIMQLHPEPKGSGETKGSTSIYVNLIRAYPSLNWKSLFQFCSSLIYCGVKNEIKDNQAFEKDKIR